MTKDEFQRFIYTVHTTPKVLTVEDHSFVFHLRADRVLVSSCKDKGRWYGIGAVIEGTFVLNATAYPVSSSRAKLDWLLAQDEFECTVKTASYRQTRYAVKREPVQLKGGPFHGATVWLDEAGSARTTAPIRVGEHYGCYHDRQWRSL